ncbi:MAG: tRNA (adenosine(37)-N6)-threonylcarbamoyltransferase complex transferase subunit TsaD [Gammaproteobacteria bacterium CG_4_10_14_0_8_um_filter_38_16]|nr:MAG: tRNA (adenosine(37)-N6)-threonylcarbamoyltransferase complex transferase subunit TsaD [Gammaproteobacteria bacterium CG_4_10_14_0_8_um_filter_38_16]PJA03521.1 MAG: tRNA (adenosine(37)-N6)-threonylcarbamoyltransferase complex transferase subunit TsaD [Gammaproteobacteria bacterium CG_4_10_14_0_2_um_filter_38_22]PJB11143.1 MAG: tRNA (adenosine(37)-N6)-threonylcarbamoyltransferase complex transferase subunit TsaD [Gammaproteobacteria bacterium CG_4_9_14_3_um_filter_38_9]
MKILGIETSCDETAVAIVDRDAGLLGQLIHSQIDLHQKYGGVVPELASRDHIQKLLPLIQSLLLQFNLSSSDISAIAYTRGPGLIGALMVGSSIARSLAFAWQVPSIGVHHLESHLMAVMLEKDKPTFPFVTLLVSGGHTMLLYAKKYGDYDILGETLDDAAGEAFDKTAKLLGLAYPGGPALAKLALKGNAKRFHFPRPMLNRPGLAFSFSGLKTAAINCFMRHEQDEQLKADIACAFEDAVIETLMKKAARALEAMCCDQLVIAGGVSANEKLREQANKLTKQGKKIFFPRREFCTDNAAMVAINGLMRLLQNEKDALDVDVKARWPMDEIKN